VAELVGRVKQSNRVDVDDELEVRLRLRVGNAPGA
jgi:hypothetical protein